MTDNKNEFKVRQVEPANIIRNRKPMVLLPEGYGLPREGFIRIPILLGLLQIGKSTLWKGIKEGRFPAPVKLGPKISVWRVEDVRILIETVGGAK
jgi:prophage regulatory protein